ncbi:uncharacterized protein LOC114373843 [Glycine soja]|uniref:uncharacterized protein n=1 Tax=Glycine max TaxID=3847 RepID=UPI0003DEA1CC|nr:uncharacterized protein LOC102661015 [Glycine max]XP_028187196.1 uncharacterized protein LOC114373843 [Glycine soja]|eukprot:XP_006575899.1 uncharacterized protein LOC102661015 [Glycine max]
MGNPSSEAVYAELRYLVGVQNGSHQKVIKGSALEDYLAQQPKNDYQPMHPEFPNEDIMTLFEEEVEDDDRDKWIMWFDGASNALGHGIGAVLVSPDEQYIPFTTRLGFDCTNNIAKYEACALGIRAAIDFRVKLLKSGNQMADTLATLEKEEDGKPWYFNIKRYIEDKEYPPEAFDNDKRTLRRLAADFLLSGNILYKRNHDMVLFRRVDAREAKQMLIEVQEGSFGMHANGHAMA